MESQYIVAIIVGGMFFLLCVVYSVYVLLRYNAKKRLWARLTENYNDVNLAKMQYDFIPEAEEAEHIPEAEEETPDEQVTIYDVLSENKSAQPEETFTKLEGDGIEEITGNYKPE